ncbi:hypothetical protein [Neolewinella antarctica]|uniref:Uncharacterized protein n=1 Tax=Neolewinella antarctica TaxID=442734 RepID=A0ABX0X6I9_9BACT|nr:hypothetical protein [Neolewinella antarctica]NJC24818.1 hypothetical protein [Neolewinella antarctica]
MQFSPKLKKAAQEIKGILERYDIAGAVIIHTPGYSEYVLKVNPSYSCAKIEGGMLRFKTKGLPLSPALKKQMIADTSNMMAGLSQVSGTMSLNLMAGSEKIDKMVRARHTDMGHTSQTELDN